MLDRYFKRIYIINLKSRSDRRREMADELARAGMSFDDSAVRLFSAVKPDDAGAFPSIGARGCFLSHLGILTDAAEGGAGPIAILEDDLELAQDFATRAPAVLDALGEKSWSIFYGGYEAGSFEAEGLNLVPPNLGLRTTHFICFNGPAIAPAKKYLEAILARPAGDAQGGPMHVDGAYSWLRKDNREMATYAAWPPLGNQRRSRSDIAGPRWFDRMPGLNKAAAVARRLLRSQR
jgi:glycosyl transferase, family 25